MQKVQTLRLIFGILIITQSALSLVQMGEVKNGNHFGITMKSFEGTKLTIDLNILKAEETKKAEGFGILNWGTPFEPEPLAADLFVLSEPSGQFPCVYTGFLARRVDPLSLSTSQLTLSHFLHVPSFHGQNKTLDSSFLISSVNID